MGKTINEQSIIAEEENFVPDYDKTIKVFRGGDLVKGTVVKIDRDGILVDVGYKSEGIIPPTEVSIRSGAYSCESLSVGDEVEVVVLQVEDKEGRMVLSRRRAKTEKAWRELELAKEEEKVIEGEVIEVVKGGLILDIGLRGFLPASLVDVVSIKDLRECLGKKFECKIIEMNKSRNSVVLSRRALLETAKKDSRQKILEKLEKGQIVTGKISSIVDFGAFVNVGGVDGLIHISELSWNRVSHPSEIVSVGDEVKVQILNIDMDRERLSLGLKQTQIDPWREKIEKFSVGDEVKSKVSRLVPFGVFVEFTDGLEGLIHLSELSVEQVKLPEEVVKMGDKVKARIIEIDLERRRISLSLKPLAMATESAEEVKEEVKEEIVKEVILEEVKEEAKEEGTVQVAAGEEVEEELKEETEPGSLEAILAEMKKARQQK